MMNSKKNNIHVYWILLFVSFLLVACSPQSSLTKEEVAEKVRENQDNVELYTMEVNLEIHVKDLTSALITQDTTTYTELTLNEKTMDSYGIIQSSTLEEELLQNHYSVGKQAYLKLNDGTWEDVSSVQEEYFGHMDSFYPNLTPIVDVLSKLGELNETKDEYIFTFSGESADIYHSFQEPYSIQFGFVEPKDIHQEVEVIVEKDTFFLKSINNRLIGKTDVQELEISIQQVYFDMNGDVDFVIPQEVIDEAKP